jgi:hypothetical protein
MIRRRLLVEAIENLQGEVAILGSKIAYQQEQLYLRQKRLADQTMEIIALQDKVKDLEASTRKLLDEYEYNQNEQRHPAKFKKEDQVNIIIDGAIIPGKIYGVDAWDPAIMNRRYLVSYQKGLDQRRCERTEDQIMVISLVNDQEQQKVRDNEILRGTTGGYSPGCCPTISAVLYNG